MRIFYSLLFTILTFHHCFAFVPEKHLPEQQEQKARELFLQIRCPVCAGQVIDSSETEIAFELRKLVREQISAGKSDKEIKSYLIEKYGDDILNSPPFNTRNALLWILPSFFMIFGILVIWRFNQKT